MPKKKDSRNTRLLNRPLCEICGRPGAPAGKTIGFKNRKVYGLLRCPACAFLWVHAPHIDVGNPYDESYYGGSEVDPTVDYYYELRNPKQTIRRLEWEGILRFVRANAPVGGETRWLDFGCGNGGLVRFLRENGVPRAEGFEDGSIVAEARRSGIPILPWRQVARRKYDVVTAVEVLEHTLRPLEVLARIRMLLKPGGLFFYTTGNPQSYSGDIGKWYYMSPEIHWSFFEPQVMEKALKLSGLNPEFPKTSAGWSGIYAYRVLKKMKIKKWRALLGLVPWFLVARILDLKFKLKGYPLGRT